MMEATTGRVARRTARVVHGAPLYRLPGPTGLNIGLECAGDDAVLRDGIKHPAIGLPKAHR